MTKLTFDVDFNKDPEEILREIQERKSRSRKAAESKIRSASYLSKLHEKVNEDIGTDYKSISDLIRGLTQFANPKLKDKLTSSSSTGRRITVSMTRELFDEIKSRLAQPNPNKAAIARETGASVVQVRKVASGGYDSKFSKATTPPSSPSSAKPSASAISDPIIPQSPEAEKPVEEPSTPPQLPPISPPPVEEVVREKEPTDPTPPLDLPPSPSDPEPIAPPPHSLKNRQRNHLYLSSLRLHHLR